MFYDAAHVLQRPFGSPAAVLHRAKERVRTANCKIFRAVIAGCSEKEPRANSSLESRPQKGAAAAGPLVEFRKLHSPLLLLLLQEVLLAIQRTFKISRQHWGQFSGPYFQPTV